MTRFQMEVSGQLGEFWIRNARKEAEAAAEDFRSKAYVEDGVVRWKSNDRVPFDDMLEKMEYMGCQFDRIKSNEVRRIETAASFKKLRSQNRSYSEEELDEMRAAFGPGTTVVNVLTGQKIRL